MVQEKIESGGYIGYLIFNENEPHKQKKVEFQIIPEQQPEPRHVLASLSYAQKLCYIGTGATLLAVAFVLVFYYVIHTIYLPADANMTETLFKYSALAY